MDVEPLELFQKKLLIWKSEKFLAQIVHYFQKRKLMLKYQIKEELHDTTT